VCISVGARLHVCVYKGLAHPTTPSFATTHTDRCEDWREREPRLWSMASLSKYHSRSPNFSQFLSPSLTLLSLLVSLYALFPTVPDIEGLFVIQSRKHKPEPNQPCFLLDIIPLFVLTVSLHHAFGLRRHPPGTWEQAQLRQDGSRDVMCV